MTVPVVAPIVPPTVGRRRLSGRDAADRRAGRSADHRPCQGRLGGVAGFQRQGEERDDKNLFMVVSVVGASAPRPGRLAPVRDQRSPTAKVPKS